MHACPSFDELQNFLDDVLDADYVARVLAHVEDCYLCQQSLERLTVGSSAIREGLRPLAAPTDLDLSADLPRTEVIVGEEQQVAVNHGRAETQAVQTTDVDKVVSSFHTKFDQYTGHYGVGWARGIIWRYLKWFHNRTWETYVPSEATIRDLEPRGFERLMLRKRGADITLFRPDRASRDLPRGSKKGVRNRIVESDPPLCCTNRGIGS